MTDPADDTAGGSAEETNSAEATRSQTRRLRWWVSAITFVGGAVVGVLAVGLLTAGTPGFGASGPADGDPSTSLAPTSGGTIPVVAQAQVNAACLSVLNEAQDLAAILSGLDEAVTDVDLQHLDDIVRQIQPIQPRLSRDLQACEINVAVANPVDPQTPSSPTPLATSSPTG